LVLKAFVLRPLSSGASGASVSGNWKPPSKDRRPRSHSLIQSVAMSFSAIVLSVREFPQFQL
jgi:hypothetical protein